VTAENGEESEKLYENLYESRTAIRSHATWMYSGSTFPDFSFEKHFFLPLNFTGLFLGHIGIRLAGIPENVLNCIDFSCPLNDR